MLITNEHKSVGWPCSNRFCVSGVDRLKRGSINLDSVTSPKGFGQVAHPQKARHNGCMSALMLEDEKSNTGREISLIQRQAAGKQ